MGSSLQVLTTGHFEQIAADLLKQQLAIADLVVIGIGDSSAAAMSAAMCVEYVAKTQMASAGHLNNLHYFRSTDFMVLDAITLRNLDICSVGTEKKRTLLDVIDRTVTGMGSRLLQSWILRPSIKRGEIQTRLAAVEELGDPMTRDRIRFLLKEVADLERVVGRLNLASAASKDLLALSRSLAAVPDINLALADASSLLLQVLSENIFELPELRALISSAISEDAPANISDGGTIRDGYDSELDELRAISMGGKSEIARFEDAERERTGISNLKVRFNNVFGYYIEVSKGNVSRVPDDYERRQTLANAERYSTPHLKDWEAKILRADEEILRIEQELFQKVCNSAKAQTKNIQATARALSALDALASFAQTASERDYVCPSLHDGDEIEVKNGRHPIVEAFVDGNFIPNDIYLNNSTDRLLVITGANMGGKSTILRQTALFQVLAQAGSFVPATQARLPILDRIWTRVGASDDLASGRSTFMVEMTETASILRNCTSRSLILLDEIGRGTSTFDGLSIAWAVAEYLHNSPEHAAKTLFATHYHELTELAEMLPGAQNYQVAAAETDGDVVFLHKLEKGKASKSYGIAVAKIAGLPPEVISRANEVLAKLEEYELAVFKGERSLGNRAAASRAAAAQTSLFSMANDHVIDELRATDLDSLSEGGAKVILSNLKDRIV